MTWPGRSWKAVSARPILHSLVLITLGVIECVSGAGKACEDSGYCSVGQSKPWYGDIRTGAGLRAMLEAVSFNRELIITAFTTDHQDHTIVAMWIDQVLQLHWELEMMGYGHFVVVVQAPEACKQLHQYVPHLSCVWDSTPLDLWPDSGYANRVVWFNRWKLFARAGRLGYNLMSLDADTLIMRDPYKHIKSGPMASIQLWCNPEFGPPLICNGGFVYIQDTRPDGPVTWIFKQLVTHQMWMMDDQYEVAQSRGGTPACYSFDQDALHDGVRSAFVGRPVHLSWLLGCVSEGEVFKTPAGLQLTRRQVEALLQEITGSAHQILNTTQMPAPADWLLGLVPDAEDWGRVMTNRLTVPNMAYGYPEELGGRLGAARLLRSGNVSAWEAQLREDCPDCPWWQEERPVKASLAFSAAGNAAKQRGKPGVISLAQPWQLEKYWDPSVPVEMIGIGPGWLSNSMHWGYRAGMWAGRAAGLPAPFAISHVHFWPDLSREHKIQVRKVLGRYNYSLAAAVLPDSPYLCRVAVQRVLALHPSIDLRRTRDVGEFNAIIAGLIQVAHLTHHTVLLPDLPCGAPWLHDDSVHNTSACRAPFHQGADKLRLPSALPYPVDGNDNLIGGWLRKLLIASGASSQSLPPQAAASDLGPAPIKSVAQQQAFWHNQSSWRFAMGYLWDITCTLHIGSPGAIITPEYVHWRQSHLTAASQPSHSRDTPGPLHSPEPRNTVLLPGDARLLKMRQALPASEDQGDGWVLKPQPDLGWSVADAQVVLPAGQVVQAVSRAAQASHIVYLGHPVAVIESQHRHKRGDRKTYGHGKSAAKQKRFKLLGVSSSKGASHKVSVAELDSQLARINQRLTGSKCRVLQGSSHTPLDLQFTDTRLGVVRANKVHLLTPKS